MSSTVYVNPDSGQESISFTVNRPEGGWARVFSNEYKQQLRPIAETLAMLDGNAFFGISGSDFYEAYLSEADAIYRENGGDNGWASEASWIKDLRLIQNDPTLKDAYDKLQILLTLKRNENGNI